MPLQTFNRLTPVVHRSAFIAPDAWVIGDVRVLEGASVFFQAVLRGDIEPIVIGRGTNIQEHALLHTSTGGPGVLVGHDCTIGHRAIVHGATVGNNVLVGMGSTILDGSVIGDNCLVGAHALVLQGTEIPPGKMVLGSPAKVVRDLRPEEIENITRSARDYERRARTYLELFKVREAP